MKYGLASLKALGFFVALGVAAHAAMPYLPLVGPPPMRVQTPAPKSSVAVIHFAGAVAPTNTDTQLPVTAETATPSGETNATATAVGPFPIPAVTGPADYSSVAGPPTAIFAMPTPDLFGISPQMLATYFNPVPFSTNGTRMSFLPPLPPLPPDKSSHAEYNVK